MDYNIETQIKQVNEILDIDITTSSLFRKEEDSSDFLVIFTSTKDNSVSVSLIFIPDGLNIKVDRVMEFYDFGIDAVINKDRKFVKALNQLFYSDIEVIYFGKNRTLINFYNKDELVDKKSAFSGIGSLFSTKRITYEPLLPRLGRVLAKR